MTQTIVNQLDHSEQGLIINSENLTQDLSRQEIAKPKVVLAQGTKETRIYDSGSELALLILSSTLLLHVTALRQLYRH